MNVRYVPTSTRGRVAGTLALALVALAGGTLVTWASGTGPFAERRLCWGAWQEESGPDVLGDAYERTVRESGAPARGERAACVVGFRAAGTESADAADVPVDGARVETSGGQRLVAHVGPPPRSARERRTWLAGALHGSAAPLPDGVPGVVARDRGMLVLPEKCDSGGLPATVTLRGEGEVPDLGSESEVADLLLSLAGTARERMGCAGGGPSRITAPVRTRLPEEEFAERAACRIPGMRFAPRRGALTGFAGEPDGGVRACSLEVTGKDGGTFGAGQFVVTSRPRLTALFRGMPAEELVTAECRGRPTVFFMGLDDRMDQAAVPSADAVFARSVASVTAQLGCPAAGRRG